MTELVHEIAGLLGRSGVASPAPEARTLVAHVLGVEPRDLLRVRGVSDEQRAMIDALAARRAAGEPLQHITGLAYFRYETLSVGPGVFIPRPETEEMVGWALSELARRPVGARRVVELCAGSGAITAALARELGGLDLYAVELSADAFGYLERNLEAVDVHLVLGDMASAFPELDGTVDLVIANPPYIPEAHRVILPDDVVLHDPHLALFSGADGLDALRVVAETSSRLLKPGGLVAAEHDESHAEDVVRLFADGFHDVTSRRDLTRRPRYVTAVRSWQD
ncbi:peptide chain release factor N(5)-glutamine methyltransferase [Tessaracoccus flavus]|uniref:Release factor glutamine methyltransferase n=1 Tax=Tessaracoccus flavus TaxID=1610493 RepID=A0A1Q2CER6_9ACTN|nr:peptide chain release factor N(5)-glutamine methyltransferase [Tessaracoccus flavus]AQP44545.1 protein-(glutamine-N5) methyltransferase, release factor-specific [Tessaracoccus flavus]SDZ10078.1 release factor glutamine methyltransferase [Tessaracoccus flavus]